MLMKSRKKIVPMGLTRVLVSSRTAPFIVILFFLFISPVFGNNLSFQAEISRLEKICLSSANTSRERYDAFLALARLHQLGGNAEKAVKVYDDGLKLFPADGRLLLEQGRLLISLGEYERAVGTVASMLALDKEFYLQGRLVLAQLEAFRSGNIGPLEALTRDADFSGYKSGIYYTLWRLTDTPEYKAVLTRDFASSPEAKIASGKIAGEPTPLWLLFSGREAITFSDKVTSLQLQPVTPSQPEKVTVTTSITTQPEKVTSLPLQPVTPFQIAVLQVGIYNNEAHARDLGERLKHAGFQSQIGSRLVNGSNYWTVTVSTPGDPNAMMKKLKDSGFDAFPLK